MIGLARRVVTAAVLLAAGITAQAQPYPNQGIKVVVPYGPGRRRT
jgi:tripartite-type tricarboxylate transporter receptor subunit TctC